MTTVAWALLVIGCSVWMYRRGYSEGAEVAKRLGQIAVERERIRCTERVKQRLYGPQMIVRPSMAERN